MKRYQLAGCTSPSVTFEIGKEIITSSVIKNTKKNPNFDTNNIFYREVVRRTFSLHSVFCTLILCYVLYYMIPSLDITGLYLASRNMSVKR